MDFESIAVLGIVGVILYSLWNTSAVSSIENAVSSFATGNLTASQIAGYASTAGWSGPDLATAVAIALAESGGNPNAHGDLSLGQGSYGLWQIYSTAHPECGPDFSLLFDPQTNANCAYGIYSRAGNNFSAWTTYGSGRYLAFMPSVQQALSA